MDEAIESSHQHSFLCFPCGRMWHILYTYRKISMQHFPSVEWLDFDFSLSLMLENVFYLYNICFHLYPLPNSLFKFKHKSYLKSYLVKAVLTVDMTVGWETMWKESIMQNYFVMTSHKRTLGLKSAVKYQHTVPAHWNRIPKHTKDPHKKDRLATSSYFSPLRKLNQLLEPSDGASDYKDWTPSMQGTYTLQQVWDFAEIFTLLGWAKSTSTAMLNLCTMGLLILQTSSLQWLGDHAAV